MQLDHWVYEHDLRTRVIPEGQRRASVAAGTLPSEPVTA
jgi:hypothetical protein